MSDTLEISGTLAEKDIQRLTNATRGGSIGPTTVYYAGLTAPVIAAGMTLVARTTFESAGMTTYWTFLLSTLIAAMAGISWYLIFMRWASRDRAGRTGETQLITTIRISDEALEVSRGEVDTRIGWAAVTSIQQIKGATAIFTEGAGTVLLPDSWFQGAPDTAAAVKKALTDKIEQGT